MFADDATLPVRKSRRSFRSTKDTAANLAASASFRYAGCAALGFAAVLFARNHICSMVR